MVERTSLGRVLPDALLVRIARLVTPVGRTSIIPLLLSRADILLDCYVGKGIAVFHGIVRRYS